MKSTAKLLSLTAIVVFALSSCTLLFQTAGMQSRIASFESDLNTEDRTLLYLNFSELAEDYDAIKNGQAFETGPFAYANRGDGFVIDVTDASEPDNVQATLTNANLDSQPLTFVMVQEGFSWYIREISLTIGGVNYSIKQLSTL